MKKIIVSFLIFAICCGFAACNAPEVEYKTDIVGEWMSPAVNAAAVFNEDGSGELTLNGTHSAGWTYLPDSDKYAISADKSYTATYSVEYSMPILTIDGIDFYRPDDYDKAFTLLISRRYEKVTELTIEMTKLELNKVYDLENGITISFSDVSVSTTEENDGLFLEYQIINNRTDAITQPLYIEPYAEYFLADYQNAVVGSEHMVLAVAMDGSAAFDGGRRFSLDGFTAQTISRYGRVIGVLTFEMYGTHYYIDLADYFRQDK